MRGLLIACALAGCTDPPDQAFVVDGFVDVAVPPTGSVIGLWTIPGAAAAYKLGDGIRVGARFTLGFETDPPAAALGADGIGVALAVMLPEFATVPDGPVEDRLGVLGLSANTAVIYKRGDATGPAWAAAFPPRFSCAQCVRSPTGGLDTWELTPCAAVIIEGPADPTCQWY